MTSRAELDDRLEFGRAQSRAFLERLSGLGPPVPSDLDEILEGEFRRALRERFPDDPVIGEELPPRHEWSGTGWLVDPIDGTTNLRHGLPWFCTSLCYVIDGVPTLGWVVDPSRREVFEAIRGRGATVQGATVEGERLDLRDRPASPLVCIGRRYRRRHPGWRAHVQPGSKDRLLGATALELAWIARGVLGAGAWARSRVFDIAAGWLLLDEAGAIRIGRPDATPLLDDPDLGAERHEFVAGHPDHRPWLEALVSAEEVEGGPDGDLSRNS